MGRGGERQALEGSQEVAGLRIDQAVCVATWGPLIVGGGPPWSPWRRQRPACSLCGEGGV